MKTYEKNIEGIKSYVSDMMGWIKENSIELTEEQIVKRMTNLAIHYTNKYATESLMTPDKARHMFENLEYYFFEVIDEYAAELRRKVWETRLRVMDMETEILEKNLETLKK